VAEGPELSLLDETDETSEPTPRHVLEEDPLDRIVRTEPEDLVALRLNEFSEQARKTLSEVNTPPVCPGSRSQNT
jgi:hypothetical protein